MEPAPGTTRTSFRHEALLYRSTSEYLSSVGTFILDGVAAGEPVLVGVDPVRGQLLRDLLGPHLNGDAGITFADIDELARNPARLIPAWRDFIAQQAPGVRVRGVGESIWPGRSRAEVLEVQRHEALLAMAFGNAEDIWLLCPYDVENLDADVIAEAFRSHPWVIEQESLRPGGGEGSDVATPHLDEPLGDPPYEAAVQHAVTDLGLAALRQLVYAWAGATGMPEDRVDLFVLAVNELTTNSIEHGGGSGELYLWRDGTEVVAEAQDLGHIVEPLVGRVRPGREQSSGRGIWLVNQICDLVQLRSSPGGTTARIRMRVDAAPPG